MSPIQIKNFPKYVKKPIILLIGFIMGSNIAFFIPAIMGFNIAFFTPSIMGVNNAFFIPATIGSSLNPSTNLLA